MLLKYTFINTQFQKIKKFGISKGVQYINQQCCVEIKIKRCDSVPYTVMHTPTSLKNKEQK